MSLLLYGIHQEYLKLECTIREMSQLQYFVQPREFHTQINFIMLTIFTEHFSFAKTLSGKPERNIENRVILELCASDSKDCNYYLPCIDTKTSENLFLNTQSVLK